MGKGKRSSDDFIWWILFMAILSLVLLLIYRLYAEISPLLWPLWKKERFSLGKEGVVEVIMHYQATEYRIVNTEGELFKVMVIIFDYESDGLLKNIEDRVRIETRGGDYHTVVELNKDAYEKGGLLVNGQLVHDVNIGEFIEQARQITSDIHRFYYGNEIRRNCAELKYLKELIDQYSGG